MNFKSVKKGMLIALVMFAIVIPVKEILAIDKIDNITFSNQESGDKNNHWINLVAKIQQNQNENLPIKIMNGKEILFHDKLLKFVFAKTEEGHALVYADKKEDSDWVGKVFENSAVTVIEKEDVWSKIQSGTVIGYVKTENLIIGNGAVEQAKSILTKAYPERNIYELSEEEIEAGFSVGETREAEELRIAAEEQERKIAQENAILQRRAAVVNYAKQFIGNPYVYGGTSLTRGTDCSGLVKGVYQHFGVELPRTSSAIRRVGYAVSVNEMQPGDIVCYHGHVGIYAGNGQMVNAIDEQKGIGMSNINYKLVISVRRIF